MPSKNVLCPSRRPRRRALVGAVVLVAALGGVACGDDDSGPGEAKAEFASYCDASFNLETYFGQDPDVDFETASPEQVAAAVRTYLQTAKPLVDAVVPLTPAEIKDAVDVQVRAFNQSLAGGDPEAAFETPEVDAASDKQHAFDLENCGWGKVEVSATEYSFSGLPRELKAGRTSIDLNNKGKELHEIVLLARNPGVTETFDQILALPEEEAMTKVRPAAGAFAEQGKTEYAVTELAKGTYLAVCFLPQGFTSQESQPSPGAKPHFLLGMKQEIKVA